MKIEDISFKVGLYIKVPKNTPLYSRWHGELTDEKTSRDVIVEITDVNFPNFESMLTKEEIQTRTARYEAYRAQHEIERVSISEEVHYPAMTYPATRFGQSYTKPAYSRFEIPTRNKGIWTEMCYRQRDEIQAVTDEYRQLGESRFVLDEILVSWAKGAKTTAVKYVTLEEKPESRKKEPKVNIRQQMVPKSRWKVTKDIDIYYGEENIAFTAAKKAWDKANPRPQWSHNTSEVQRLPPKKAAYQAWTKAQAANLKHLEKTLGEFVPKLYCTIKTGDVFEVAGKFDSFFMPNGWSGQRYTNTVPVVFMSGNLANKIVQLEYMQIKDIIESDSIPTVKAFVLRHKDTGQFYKSYVWNNYSKTAVYQLEYCDTFMKGKKWDNLGKAKTSILMMTGYYDGLPGADEALPEWSGGNACMTDSQLREFELVEFDKLSRKEVGVVADFAEWFDRTWQLRELTMKYGSSVRTVYKALEKGKMLDTQKGVAVFTVTDENALDNVSYWGDRTALTDEDKKEIDLALKSVEGKFKKAMDHKSAAVSFPNKGAAMMFRLAYSGKLKVSIIDLEDMKEAVGD